MDVDEENTARQDQDISTNLEDLRQMFGTNPPIDELDLAPHASTKEGRNVHQTAEGERIIICAITL